MISAVGIASSRNLSSSTSLTGRILTVALGVLSGFQHVFANQAMQIPGSPGTHFAVASAGEQAVALWLNAGQLHGAVVHPSSAVNSRIVHKSASVLSSFAIDCWDKGCLVALNICHQGRTIYTTALPVGVNGSDLVVDAEHQLAQQRVGCSSGGHIAVQCSPTDCSAVWNTGGTGSTLLRRAVCNFVNSTCREVDNGGIGWVRDPAGLAYVGSVFLSLSTYRVANHMIVHRWSEQGTLLTSLNLKNTSESLDPRGSAVGCYDSGKCLGVWLVNRGKWDLTGRFFDSNGTLLDWVELMGIGPDLSIPQFGSSQGLGILGQSNATHLMYSLISPDGDQSAPIFLLAASDTSTTHVPFAIRQKSGGAILIFWSTLENSNMMHWIEAPRMSTSSTLMPLPTSLTMTQATALAGSQKAATIKLSRAVTTYLENRTVVLMTPSEVVTEALSDQSSPSGNVGATIGAVVGVAGSILCTIGAILRIRQLRSCNHQDIDAGGTQPEQSEVQHQPSAAGAGQYASISRVPASDYVQLELGPDNHYEDLNALNAQHDEYMSARMQRHYDDVPQSSTGRSP